MSEYIFKNKKIILILFAFIMFISLQFEGGFFVAYVKAADDKEEVEENLKDLEDKKEEELEKMKRYEGDVDRLQGAVYTTQADINQTANQIKKTEETIERKEAEIEEMNEKIEKQKKILGKLIQETYYDMQIPVLYMLLDKEGFVEATSSVDHLNNMKRKIVLIMKKIEESKEEIKEDKKELEEKKEEHEDLLAKKEQQKRSYLVEKQRFERKLEEKKLTVADIDKKIAKLRSILSSFLGESYDAKDIIDAIRFASKKTGLRKEFLMAMLDKESDLGRFTGGCTYKNTRVKDSDKKVFKDICEELNYDYKKQKISCALSYGYGGAMGVAQFMPTTWIGYKDAIASMTGHNPPDPWNLTDGVVGMAEKLRRAGADDEDNEHYAAKLYYCGSPRSSYWDTHCEAYADTVKSWSEGYDEYF